MPGEHAGVNLIELDGICKVYGSGAAEVRALDEVSLTVSKGEFVAVMGPIGSGKSTAMNLIGLLDTPTSGTYRFAGANASQLDRAQRGLLRRYYLGFVFQGFNLLARTSALDNVELPLIYQGVAAGQRKQLAMPVLPARWL